MSSTPVSHGCCAEPAGSRGRVSSLRRLSCSGQGSWRDVRCCTLVTLAAEMQDRDARLNGIICRSGYGDGMRGATVFGFIEPASYMLVHERLHSGGQVSTRAPAAWPSFKATTNSASSRPKGKPPQPPPYCQDQPLGLSNGIFTIWFMQKSSSTNSPASGT